MKLKMLLALLRKIDCLVEEEDNGRDYDSDYNNYQEERLGKYGY